MSEGAPTIQRVSLRIVRADFAYVDLQVPGLHLSGIEAKRAASGAITLKCPVRTDRNGRPWPLFALQSPLDRAVEEAVAAIWEQALNEGQGAEWTH